MSTNRGLEQQPGSLMNGWDIVWMNTIRSAFVLEPMIDRGFTRTRFGSRNNPFQ
jgi:hypothetical protein